MCRRTLATFTKAFVRPRLSIMLCGLVFLLGAVIGSGVVSLVYLMAEWEQMLPEESVLSYKRVLCGNVSIGDDGQIDVGIIASTGPPSIVGAWPIRIEATITEVVLPWPSQGGVFARDVYVYVPKELELSGQKRLIAEALNEHVQATEWCHQYISQHAIIYDPYLDSMNP